MNFQKPVEHKRNLSVKPNDLELSVMIREVDDVDIKNKTGQTGSLIAPELQWQLWWINKEK